jgi:transcriptional regulator with XRE-family HTH domain
MSPDVSQSKDALRSVGTLIRAKRTSAGLTQHAVAKRAGLSAKYVSEIERGTRDVPFSTLHAIVESGLGLTLEVAFPVKPTPRSGTTRPPLPKPIDDVARQLLDLPNDDRTAVLSIIRDLIALASR